MIWLVGEATFHLKKQFRITVLEEEEEEEEEKGSLNVSVHNDGTFVSLFSLALVSHLINKHLH